MMIAGNPTLNTLDISSNFFTKDCAQSLHHMLSKSPGLRNLNISTNPIKVEGATKILEAVKANNIVERL